MSNTHVPPSLKSLILHRLPLLTNPTRLHNTLESLRSQSFQHIPSTTSSSKAIPPAERVWLVLTTATLVSVSSQPGIRALYHRLRWQALHGGEGGGEDAWPDSSSYGEDAASTTGTSLPSSPSPSRPPSPSPGPSTTTTTTDWDGLSRRVLLVRETALKCVSFVGIPKVINGLAALKSATSKDRDVEAALKKFSARRRVLGAEGMGADEVMKRAENLWTSIYNPVDVRLLERLKSYHPDLPEHILSAHYGSLLSDPPTSSTSSSVPTDTSVGRTLTSLAAVAALRAQGDAGPQLLSHVLGLKKARGQVEGEEERQMEWLTGDEGAEWAVRAVDGIVEAVREGGAAAGARREEGGKAQAQAGGRNKL